MPPLQSADFSQFGWIGEDVGEEEGEDDEERESKADVDGREALVSPAPPSADAPRLACFVSLRRGMRGIGGMATPYLPKIGRIALMN